MDGILELALGPTFTKCCVNLHLVYVIVDKPLSQSQPKGPVGGGSLDNIVW